MSTDNKHTEWILETIDHLRGRKARPDLKRICHVVRRNFGLQAADTEAKLEKLIDAEVVIKVDYKGSTSYRNAAKWRKSTLGCAVQNSRKVSTKVVEAVLRITTNKANGNSASKCDDDSKCNDDERKLIKQTTDGDENENKPMVLPSDCAASFTEITGWLQTHYEEFKNIKSPMGVVFKREVDAGRLRRLNDGRLMMTEAQSSLIKDGVIDIVDFPPTTPDSPSNSSSTAQEVNTQGQTDGLQPARRGRPPKYRPHLASQQQTSPSSHKPQKLKRSTSTGSGGESTSSQPAKILKKTHNNDSNACDVCQLTSHSSGKGEKEILLQCSDCRVKAHPSCLKYNTVLASRAQKGPWQCTDCKTCCVCHDSDQPSLMLFCDGCDKGYHMTCHQPSVTKKPSGLWECYECRLENSTLQRSEFFAMHNQRRGEVQDSSPPTPAESPDPSRSPQSQVIYPDASEWTVDDVAEFFMTEGFLKEAQTFKDQEIDGIAMLLLRRSDVLKGLDLKLGPALKINRLVERLQTAKQQMT